MDISKAIKLAMVHRDLKGKDLAVALSVSPAYISSLLNHKKNPSIQQMAFIATALDYKLSELIAFGEE